MPNSLNTVLQKMDQKTVTLGWDVVVAYHAAAVNKLFTQQYVTNVRENQHLPPFTSNISLGGGAYVEVVNLTLGPPLISFTPSLTDQQAMVEMNFIAGEVMTTDQNGSVTYVSAYQSIVPGDQYSLSMEVELQQTHGKISDQRAVVVDLQNASTFKANLLPGTGSASLLGVYFQSIFEKATQGTLTYKLGSLVMGTDLNLTPSSFEIRAQVYPETSGPDGAVLLLVATTYHPSGGDFPGTTYPYLIPDGQDCALVVASKTLFGNIIEPYYTSTLKGDPTLSLKTVSGSSPASCLSFTSGKLDVGKVENSWDSGGGVTHEVWSGTPGSWSAGRPNKQPVKVPFKGLSVKPKDDLLSMSWSHKFHQNFAATTCAPKTGCVASKDSVTLAVSASFSVSATIDNNNVSFAGGTPDVHVSFEKSSWISKWFGNGDLRDEAAKTIARRTKTAVSAVLDVGLPQVNTFAVSHLLFPQQNVLQFQSAHLPGDLALFGAISPHETAFSVSPLQATVVGGGTQQFSVSNGKNAVWTVFPRIGSISPEGVYSAPQVVTKAAAVEITATQGNDVSTSVVVLVPSPIQVSPSYTIVLPGGNSIQLEAALVGNVGQPQWTLSPHDGSAGTLNSTGLYSPPTQFPAGDVTLATATASVAGRFASCLLCLLKASIAIPIEPPSVELGPHGTKQFSSSSRDPVPQWSVLTPGLGTITANGLYTAPAAIPQQTTALVCARWAGVNSVVGIAVVILMPFRS